jgi:RNA polymerase sigma-B factor
MPSVAVAAPTRAGPLTGDGAGSLFLRWQQHGDRAARDELVSQFMPLARTLARRYRHSSEPLEDLLQVASLGLLKALDRFDPEAGNQFPSFAVPTILGEIRRYFRDSGWAVHMPRGAQEQALQVRDAQQSLTGEQGHAPTVVQLAQYLELDAEQVLDALQALQAYETLSLDAPPPSVEDEAMTFGDALGHEDDRYGLIEMDVSITSAMVELPARERAILHMRFVEDLTQTEIAARVGVSQMQVSRLLRGSLNQLRSLIDAPQASAA